MSTAVIYARYSSYNQTERSIEGQIEDCEKYAQANNITIIGHYIDRAKSGTEAEHRTEFLQMIKDAERRQFDMVLVYKLDRFARNRYDSAIYKAKLKKHGVRVISVMEPIADDPTGIILESMLEGMAEYYSANLSQNVKRGLAIARERGTFTGGHLPYGYAVDDNKRLCINDDEADVVRYVFSEYAHGRRMKDIVDDVNARGVKPRIGNKFTVNSFQTVLRSEKYIGKYVYNGVEYPNIYPRIIDDETFYMVQKRFEQNKHAPAAAKAKTDYQLQGKLFCGHCGANMVGESGRGKNGVTYYYYSCANRKKHRSCKKRNEKKDFIEWYVVEQTMLYVLTPDRINYIAEKLVEEYEKEFSTSNIAKLQKLLEATEREINDCIDLMIKNKASDLVIERLNKKVEELTVKKADISVDLAKLRIASQHAFTADEYKAWLNSFRRGDPLDENYRRRVIDTFVNAVYLFDDRVVIYYNIKDGKQVSYIDMCDDLEDLASSDNLPSCSDLVGAAPPKHTKSEHLFFINNGIFGIVIYRKKDES
mgnify:CR=1 FL=1